MLVYFVHQISDPCLFCLICWVSFFLQIFVKVLGLFILSGVVQALVFQVRLQILQSQMILHLRNFFDCFCFCKVKVSSFDYWNTEKREKKIMIRVIRMVRIITLNQIFNFAAQCSKVEKIYEDSLDLIPSPSAKIQIIGGKVYLS